MIDRTPFESPVPDDLAHLRRRVAEWFEGRPPVTEFEADEVRAAREAGQSVFGPVRRSDRASNRVISGPGGDLTIRIVEPNAEPRGVFLHIHGGGWVLGAADQSDDLTVPLADACNVTVVSVDYRLAPEHPYPAGSDDCEAAALWLIERAAAEWGTDRLLIGGESAGANLSAVTLLRTRDRHEYTDWFGANLVYGAYDLSDTPSVRQLSPHDNILRRDTMSWFMGHYLPNDVDPRHPDVSPLYAPLHDMPRAMFTVGTADPLLDDSLFMAMRWAGAGNETRLEIVPGAVHAFDYFDIESAARVRQQMYEFLRVS